MIELFQITGSASFAARAALEELDIPYRTVDIHPRLRGDPPEFAAVNPLRRVPALRDGAVTVYETAAVLAYLGDRYREPVLAPAIDAPERGAYLRWLVWLSNTLHSVWYPIERAVGPEQRTAALLRLDDVGAYLERELAGREWCVGDRFSLVDVYLYMLTGWQHYSEPLRLGGVGVAAHYHRVGARPAIARTRVLDDLDERLQRHHPELRAGRPV